MSAADVIEQIKELPANERTQVAKFIAGKGNFLSRRKFSIAAEADGLPVIRANDGAITSQLVHEIN